MEQEQTEIAPAIQNGAASPQARWNGRRRNSSGGRFHKREALPTRKYRPEAGLAQDSRDLRAFVPLNLDLAVLHGAASATGPLHRFGQLLLFRQTDANKKNIQPR
jgi:hypothetical protein